MPPPPPPPQQPACVFTPPIVDTIQNLASLFNPAALACKQEQENLLGRRSKNLPKTIYTPSSGKDHSHQHLGSGGRGLGGGGGGRAQSTLKIHTTGDLELTGGNPPAGTLNTINPKPSGIVRVWEGWIKTVFEAEVKKPSETPCQSPGKWRTRKKPPSQSVGGMGKRCSLFSFAMG